MRKILDVFAARTSREIKARVNDKDFPIDKEDIVSIIYRDNQFLLFYYH